jgi:hypothetical protein
MAENAEKTLKSRGYNSFRGRTLKKTGEKYYSQGAAKVFEG